jgi:hypothetical protein
MQQNRRSVADPGLAADLGDRHAVTALLQNERLLGVRKFRGFHRLPLRPAGGIRQRKTLAKNGPVFWPQIIFLTRVRARTPGVEDYRAFVAVHRRPTDPTLCGTFGNRVRCTNDGSKPTRGQGMPGAGLN